MIQAVKAVLSGLNFLDELHGFRDVLADVCMVFKVTPQPLQTDSVVPQSVMGFVGRPR
jgi:hypothetical protein